MQDRTTIRTYSELAKLDRFEDRFEYLSIPGQVGEDTFGFDRYLNQKFYKSDKWKRIRHAVIMRDNGCDLGVRGEEINSPITIHHMNPVDVEDIKNQSDYLLNPEYLISVSYDTHNAIHYGNSNSLRKRQPVIRSRDDQCPWKHN